MIADDRVEGPYVAVTARASDAVAADVAAGMLWEEAPLGIHEEDDGLTLVAYFAPGYDDAEVRADLRAAGVEVERRLVPAEDWFRRFREAFRPFEVMPGVTVRPPWEAAPESGMELIIEPGAAFGTGLHESTRGAIALLDRSCAPGTTMLDLGAGSGILSFFAARRGARVVAVDIDPQAVDNLIGNRAHNGLESAVAVVCGGPSCLRGPFPLVAANLTYELLLAIEDELLRLAAPGGRLVFAGILLERRAGALELAARLGRASAEMVLGEWLALEVSVP